MKNKKQNKMAKSRGKNVKNPALTVGVGSVTDTLYNTQGEPIEGTFSVTRGATEDTLVGTVTDWKGLWHSYTITERNNETDYPGRIILDSVNYGQNSQVNPTDPFTLTFPHGGISKTYFFGVSSEGGFNVAGRTITIS